MSKKRILQTIKQLKTDEPKGWFDKACELFGFEKVLCLLGEINA